MALEFLRSRAADTMPHLNGTLLDHLLGTERLLRSWGSPEELCLAGLCHAAYGTEGFAPFLVSWSDRGLMAGALRDAGAAGNGALGAVVEETVYFYGSCDRSVLYPQLGGHGPVTFRDRFLDATFEPSAAQLRDFVDLTLANELEIAIDGGGPLGPSSDLPAWIGPLVEHIQNRASPRARRGALSLLGQTGDGSDRDAFGAAGLL